jgi:hypothetical protein
VPHLCLQRLDFRDNDLTYVLIREISDDLIDLPLEILDFRGNPGISSEIVSDLARQMPAALFRTGISSPIKTKRLSIAQRTIRATPKITSRPKLPKTALKRDVKSGPSVQDLSRENAKLRNLVNELESGGRRIEIEPNLVIVGPRAKELKDHLVRLDKLLRELDLGVPAFLSRPGKGKRVMSARKKQRKSALK